MTSATPLFPRDNVPWELVAEFGSLRDILRMRLVSFALLESIDCLGKQRCVDLLEGEAERRQIHFVMESWERPLMGSLDGVFSPQPGTQQDGAFKCMMRCFRTMKSVPVEVMVAYNEEFGRHCIPLDHNSRIEKDKPNSAFVASKGYNLCQRKPCRTCNMKIPAERSSNLSAGIYSYVGPEKRPIDLTHFYPKCMPNMPPDLVCPRCCRSDERTLVLSILSYKSSTSRSPAGGKPLTYTPKNGVEYHHKSYNAGNESEIDLRQEPCTKRRRSCEDSRHESPSSFAFPAIYCDAALPKHDGPVVEKDDAKHAIAIHCTSCENFGIVAAASPCCHEKFPCEMRGREVVFAGRGSTVGAVFVRNQCHNVACSDATLCVSCCGKASHPIYVNGTVRPAGQSTKVPFNSWCQHCHPDGRGRFCERCAWLTTVCHHL